MKTILDKLTKVLLEHNPALYLNLNSPNLTEEEMNERINEVLALDSLNKRDFKKGNYVLSKEFIELYKWKNGSKALFEQLEFHKRLLEQCYFTSGLYFVKFEEAIGHILSDSRLFYYKNEQYFPILASGYGVFIGIKIFQENLGQHNTRLYMVMKKRIPQLGDQLYFESIENMLKTIIECYETGAYISVNGRFVCDTEKEARAGKKFNPNSIYWSTRIG